MTAKKKPVRRRKPAKKKPFDAGKVLLKGLANIVHGVTQVGGTLLLAMITPEVDIEAAGGDLIEAMNGHRCGPDCWHAIGKTKAEREAWWADRMRTYQEARDARAKVRATDWAKHYHGNASKAFEKPPTGGT